MECKLPNISSAQNAQYKLKSLLESTSMCVGMFRAFDHARANKKIQRSSEERN